MAVETAAVAVAVAAGKNKSPAASHTLSGLLAAQHRWIIRSGVFFARAATEVRTKSGPRAK
jgi:hypothetical protein